jgi:hypothetical protein
MTDTGNKSCNVCGQKFQTDQEVQEHQRTEHPEGRSEQPTSGQSPERERRDDVENVA